ncbi:DUF3857 and transglutaminase domain-containing protein [Flavobacterium selenitireducens]|uniref:DUF3857 and transglutaminase domain-containing protein n=1 Tax=Flavobacterium selenitireducens TaxID=2722704 RepID=UPI00168AD925|nr:DUF3857 domain-containing protein [Flavobacterium selenitireducens]MBD3583211.1 DUF3857 domain-containing protein [Flavobacterium selenitireducens]
MTKQFLAGAFLACAGLFPIALLGQKFLPGKVTVEQLSQKRHPSDTSAAAAVLFKKGSTRLEYKGGQGFSMVTECTQRIKIYKKDGYEWANASIPFYTGSDNEKVAIDDAVTYNLVDGKIEKTKLKREGEFIEKSNKFWSRKKIAMPGVREGSIVEFTYRITSPYFQNMPDWSFQQAIPVDYVEYETGIPEYFVYQPHFKGSLQPQVAVNSIRRKHEGKNRVKNMRTGHMEDEVYNVDFQEQVKIYSMQNVPALNDEGFVNNISNYTSSVLHELASVRELNGVIRPYANDWGSVVRTIYDNSDFGSELARNGYFETDLSVAVSGAIDPSQKLQAIYKTVKDRMNWDGMYGYYCDKGVKKAYQEKAGNVAEINLMLVAMLRSAGIKANPVLVSTRSNGVSLYPALSSYNYVIVQAEIGDSKILMDATDKWASPDILPVRDLNWFGRVIRADGSSEIVDLMPKSKSREIVNVMAKVEAKGKYNGQVRRQYFDHNAMNFRSSNATLNEESYLEKVEKSHKGIALLAYKREMDADMSKPVTESFTFEHDNGVEVIGDRMYISPLTFLVLARNPFRQEKRDYPIDFVYPHQEKINLNLTLPDGYVIESLPAAVNLAMPDNLGTFRFVSQKGENTIQIAANYDMNEAVIAPDYYDSLKDFYQKMVDKQNEKIVLKKI